MCICSLLVDVYVPTLISIKILHSCASIENVCDNFLSLPFFFPLSFPFLSSFLFFSFLLLFLFWRWWYIGRLHSVDHSFKSYEVPKDSFPDFLVQNYRRKIGLDDLIRQNMIDLACNVEKFRKQFVEAELLGMFLDESCDNLSLSGVLLLRHFLRVRVFLVFTLKLDPIPLPSPPPPLPASLFSFLASPAEIETFICASFFALFHMPCSSFPLS